MDNKEGTNKREEILIAAEKSFLQFGYAGSRTTAIAKEAGVTHAMLHYYFNTKAELYHHILEIEVKRLAKSFEVAFKKNNLPLLDRISLAVESHFDILSEYPDMAFFLITEVVNNPDRVELAVQRYAKVITLFENNFKEDIHEGVRKGLLKPVDLTQLFVTILSLNAMPFVLRPVLTGLLKEQDKTYKQFLTEKRHENVQTILNRIKG